MRLTLLLLVTVSLYGLVVGMTHRVPALVRLPQMVSLGRQLAPKPASLTQIRNVSIGLRHDF